MGLLELFVTASVPVLNVLLLTGVGSFVATDYVGILGEESRRHLNNIVFYVFNPALVSANLASTITMESMFMLWFMPVNILLTFIFGSIFGWIVIQITRPPAQLRGLILGCCAAGNLGNILLVIIPAICEEKGSPFGAPDVCHTYGIAYASLSMAIGAIFLWSIVYNIVRVSSNSIEEKSNSSSHTQIEGHPEERTTLISRDLTYGESDNDYALPFPKASLCFARRKVLTTQARILMRARKLVSSLAEVINLKRLFAPSTVGVIVGFIIGVITPIRKLMIGDGAPLRVIPEAAAILGDGAIPTLALIMGGNLFKGLQGSSIHPSLIIGVIIVRYILLPLLGIIIVKGAVHLGLVHADPLYQFILLVQYAVPPAMNIGTITQLFGAGENECSVIFLWTYALASVSLTLWSTFFMWSLS